MAELQCPVCLSMLQLNDSIVCPTCGWLHILFMGPMPESVKSFLDQKQAAMVQSSVRVDELNNTLAQLAGTVDKDRQKNAELRSQLDTRQHELEDRKAQVSMLEKDPVFAVDEDEMQRQIQTQEQLNEELKLRQTKATPSERGRVRVPIYYRLEKDILFIQTASDQEVLPPLAVGVSQKKHIHLIQDADVIFNVTLEAKNYETEQPVRVNKLTFDYASYTVSLFKSSDLPNYELTMVRI